MADLNSNVFVGRDVELDVVRACARDAAAGRPWIVVVEGAAGVGKSTFVHRVLDELTGFGVVRAEADQLAVDVAMWLVGQMAPVTASTPFAAGLDLLSFLGERQDDGPVALVVDDLHWADVASRQALLTALRRLEGDRVLAIVTTRGDDADPGDGWRRLLADDERCRHLRLGSLSPTDIAALADRAGVHLGPSALERLHQHTEGNALYVKTLLRELTPDQLNAAGVLPVPRSLAMATVALVADLPAPALALLSALAVLGEASPLFTLAAVAELDDPTRALEDALATGFIEWVPADPSRLVRFAHPLYRAALYDELSPTRRRALHLAAAAATDRVPSLLHRVAAADRADEELATALQAAAADCTDAALAARLLGSAAALSEAPDARIERTIEAGRVHYATGHVGAMRQVQTGLEALPESADRNLLLGWLAWQTGRTVEGERLLRDVVGLPGATPSQAASALCQLGAIYVIQGRGPDAVAAARSALDLQSLDEVDETRAWVILASGIGQAEGGARGLEILESRYPGGMADAAHLDPHVVWALAALTTFAGRPTEALRWFEVVAPVAQRGELPASLPHLHMLWAQNHFRLGSWDDALVHSHASVDLATDEAQTWVLAQGNSVSAFVHAARGNWDTATEHVERARDAAAAAPTMEAIIMLHTAEAGLASALGRPADVVAALAPITRGAIPGASNLQFWPMLVGAHLELGNLAEAEREVERFTAAADERSIDMQMQLIALRARLAAAAGDAVGATAGFEQALGLAGSHTDVLDRIMLHHEAARHLRALGRRREANAELGTARQLAADVGAVPYVERIDVDLAGVGRVAASAGADQLSSLTDRERDVVTLVVDGHTNRETANALYVSEKAVEWHLGNVFAKLGVTSRRQLKAALATA